MKNGDRKVASLKSDQPVHVVLKDGKTLVGTVAPSDGKVEIAALSWNLALSEHYLSNPVPGRKGNDWLYTTGLGIAVGR